MDFSEVSFTEMNMEWQGVFFKKKKRLCFNKTLDERPDWCPCFRGEASRMGHSFNHNNILLVLQIHCFPLVSHKVSVMHMRDSISSCELCRRREAFVVLQHSTPPPPPPLLRGGEGCQTVCRRGKAACTFVGQC